MGKSNNSSPVGFKVVCHALVLGWQLHIVAIGASEIVVVTAHGFVKLSLKQNVHRRSNVLGRKTTLDGGTCLGHVAYGGGGLLSDNEFANHPVDGPSADGQRAIAEVGQSRIKRILL